MSLFESILETPESPYYQCATDIKSIQDATAAARQRRLETLQRDRGRIASVEWSVESEHGDEGDSFSFPDYFYLTLEDGKRIYLSSFLNAFGCSDLELDMMEIDGQPVDELIEDYSQDSDSDDREALARLLSKALDVSRERIPGYLWLLSVHVNDVYNEQTELHLKPAPTG